MLFEIIMPGCLQFHLVIQKQSLLCSQMEQIISEGLRMENALSQFFFFFFGLGTNLGKFWHVSRILCSFCRLKIWLQFATLDHRLQWKKLKLFMIWLMIEINLWINFQFWPQRMEKWFQRGLVLPYRSAKANREKGVGWEPTFLHVALIKPSVVGKAGLDSWPFPTSAHLVHLKRPCDRNSMLQEIKCSCIPVVCFPNYSFFSSLFLFYPHFFQDLRKKTLLLSLSSPLTRLK